MSDRVVAAILLSFFGLCVSVGFIFGLPLAGASAWAVFFYLFISLVISILAPPDVGFGEAFRLALAWPYVFLRALVEGE